MNARGLVELIALNIGFDLHILSPGLFTMLVLMALTTTFMTGPILSWIGRVRQGLAARVAARGEIAEAPPRKQAGQEVSGDGS
jgi:Kef-type K+ transport system membrane component KefB